ncbi:MAG: acyloxyacyl hydrolase [Bacteroides sp.]|nr:acyloxyacyl hydrolase [Bacteroides sp.]
MISLRQTGKKRRPLSGLTHCLYPIRIVSLLGMLCLWPCFVCASGLSSERVPDCPEDTLTLLFTEKTTSVSPSSCATRSFARSCIHRIGVEAHPSYILPTNPFFDGNNKNLRPIRISFPIHLKYSFQGQPDTYTDRIYGGPYQGIGLGYYALEDREELGTPVALYLFQGARIARLDPRISVNYKWNFGISAGWKPYDYYKNDNNKAIGSRMNAYIHLGVYLNWMLSRQFDLVTGVGFSHFSNGNTKMPNAGMNTVGMNIGLVYYMNREQPSFSAASSCPAIPAFDKHISYDLLLFGSWRRKTNESKTEPAISPKAYMVSGFNFAPMYNFCYKWRAGLSVDGVYDESANTYVEDYRSGYYNQEFRKPGLSRQLALGVSVRTEYVMPYFTVGVGIGMNVLHRGGDLRACYQILSLKTDLTRNSYLHVGYSIQDFHSPNFLMLGVGYRFHNKRPFCRP